MTTERSPHTKAHPLAGGGRPDWASAWGEDKFGVFADLRFENSVQRFRWLGPGTFVRGSSEEERKLRKPGKTYVKEYSRHRVWLSRGFWIADTPVTQSVWHDVMGFNPSRFKSAERPVESVGLGAIQEFFSKVSERYRAELRLPTEAEWEYACRAGTQQGTYAYAGELAPKGEHNAPELDAIAWYGGNSGVDYDIEECEDSTEWPDKQYQHTRAGTRNVRTKQANAWGLYDMLGNVWEMCSDYWLSYGALYKTAVVDPTGPKVGTVRVIRGGAWNSPAYFVRPACPGYGRSPESTLGFRVALAPPTNGPPMVKVDIARGRQNHDPEHLANVRAQAPEYQSSPPTTEFQPGERSSPEPRSIAAFISLNDVNRSLRSENGKIKIPGTNPACTVYQLDNRRWCLRRGDQLSHLFDGEQLEFAGEYWRFVVAHPEFAAMHSDGEVGPRLSEVTLELGVSADEEDVSLSVVLDQEQRLDLGTRHRFYTLLTLARVRLDAPEPANEEAGWVFVEELCERTNTRQHLLSIHFYRLRESMRRVGIIDAAALIERRGGEVRLGTTRVTIRTA